MASWNEPKLGKNLSKKSLNISLAPSCVTDQLKFSRLPNDDGKIDSTSIIASIVISSFLIFLRFGMFSVNFEIPFLFSLSKFHLSPVGFPSLVIKMLCFFLNHR